MVSRDGNVRKALYLQCDIFSFFADEPKIELCLRKLYGSGIEKIEDLIQLSEGDIAQRARTSPGNMLRLKKELTRAGLRLKRN